MPTSAESLRGSGPQHLHSSCETAYSDSPAESRASCSEKNDRYTAILRSRTL
jgi:hypothetical protein